MRAIVHEHVRKWECSDVQVFCSGNFTTERLLSPLGRFQLHGNDVTLYSCAIGWYLAGEELPIGLAEEHLEQFGWMVDGMDRGAGTLATLMLASNVAPAIGKDRNPYYQRIVEGYRAQWPALLEKTKAKIEAVTTKLSSFSACDAAELVHAVDHDRGVVSFPPFWAGGYEALWGKLESLFEWPSPPYDEMSDERIQDFLEGMTQYKHWLFGVRRRLADYEEQLRGQLRTARGVPIYVYASGGKTRYAAQTQKTAPVLTPRLASGEEIGGTMALIRLSPEQFNALRSKHLNSSIMPAAPEKAVGVTVDGKLVGAFAITSGSHGPGRAGQSPADVPQPTAYLLSDFPVAPTDYPRLSKLIVIAALSREAQLLAERGSGRRRGLVTTAFSNNPVSMKYRGLLKLIGRKEVEDGPFRYQLNYAAEMGRWTLAEGLVEWKKTHGARSHEGRVPADAPG